MEDLIKVTEQLSRLLESPPPGPKFLKKIREIFDVLTKIEDQKKVIKILEPLMPKIISLTLKAKRIDLKTY